MKEYLKSISRDLKFFNKKIDTTASLTNRTWTVINSSYGIQRMLFRKGGELILTFNGIASEGSWKLISEANSILFNHEALKLLCQVNVFFKGLIVLKVDGQEEYLVLADEDEVPDLDVERYLKTQRIKELSNQGKYYAEHELLDGKIIEIVSEDLKDPFLKGSQATINGIALDSGLYYLKNDLMINIFNGFISEVYQKELHKNAKGQKFELYRNQYDGSYHQRIELDGELIRPGVYDYSDKYNLIVLKDRMWFSYKQPWYKRIFGLK